MWLKPPYHPCRFRKSQDREVFPCHCSESNFFLTLEDLQTCWRKMRCCPFLSATENFVKLLNKSHHVCPMSLLVPCLSQMRTWHSPSAAVIWFFIQLFCLSKVLLFWISRGESCSDAPCDGGETQMALAPHGACLRREEHRLPCTVPHWQKPQKAAPRVLSLLYFPSWYNQFPF